MTIRSGIAAQPAGSIRVEASRSSQSVSARMAAGAMISGAVREEGKLAERRLQSEMAATLGQRATFSSKEKDLRIAGAPRRQSRPLDEAEPEDHGVAIMGAARAVASGAASGSGRKNQNWRFGHGGSGIHETGSLASPRFLHMSDDC